MQTVNLLNDLPPSKIMLPAKQMIQIVFVMMLILAVISAWQWGGVYFNYRELARERLIANEVETSFLELTKRHPVIAKNKSLGRKNEQLARKLLLDKQKYEVLSQQLLKSGFSEYMALLSKEVGSDIALETIFISHVKRNMTLYGKAKRAMNVSKMIERLYHSSLLKGLTFKQYHLSKPKGLIRFEIATNALLNKKDILASTFKKGKIQQQLLRNER